MFTNTCTFKNQLSKTDSATNTAMIAIHCILQEIKGGHWSTKMKLFENLLLSVLFYCAPVWSVDMVESNECNQTTFLKKSLKAPPNTPGYTIRLETGRSPLTVNILKLIIAYMKKILFMSSTRYPKIVLERLKSLNTLQKNNSSQGFNWFTHPADLFSYLEVENF